MKDISLFVAFFAGVLSFFSPCVLPMIPFYISFISGLSINELIETGAKKKALGKVLLSAIFFVLGFSSVFISLGASATYLSRLILGYERMLRIILGTVVIIFGLHLSGIFNIRFLQTEKRFHLAKIPKNLLGSFLLGFTFAFGWTPCVDPILGTILSFAATKEKVTEGVILLSFYSLGLGLPFILTSIALGTFLSYLEKIKRYFRLISIISGMFIIGMGILLLCYN
ncbi:MAG: cytochrome c biogenesis protein CcdA [bacterium]|nr:cytochrome c biogenesis protein CcdA [bacterium]